MIDDELNIARESKAEKFKILDERSDFRIQNDFGVRGWGELLTAFPGVLLGGTVYFLVAWAVFSFGFLLFDPYASGAIPLVLIAGGIAWFFGILIGYFFVASTVALICRTLGNPFKNRTLVQIGGALTSYLLHGPFVLEALLEFNTEGIVIGVCASFLAMICFQTGALWYYNKSQSPTRPSQLHSPKHEYRFKIMHLLVVTFWCGFLCFLSPIFSNLFWFKSVGFEFGLFVVLGLLFTWLARGVHFLIFRTLERPGKPTKPPLPAPAPGDSIVFKNEPTDQV